MWQVAAGGALLGAIMGGQKSNTEQTYRKELAPESEYEKQAGKVVGDSLTDFQGLIGRGPGAANIDRSNQANSLLSQLLGSYAQGGYLPTQADRDQAQQFTQQMFAPQQTMLDQGFQDASLHANRQAARMGRSGNDPILMNKLLQEKTRQSQHLGAQMTQFFAQQAQQMPMQRLGFTQQLAGFESGLASQAMANRQALFSMGSQLRGQEQNFRNGTATTIASSSSGGGAGGAMMGALMGAGAGAKMGSFFGAGDGPATPPSTPTPYTPFGARGGNQLTPGN